MRVHWMTAALLSSALAIGCGDRTGDEARPAAENGTPAVSAPEAGEPLLEEERDGAREAPPAQAERRTAPAAGRTDAAPRRDGAAPAPSARVEAPAAPARPVVRTVTIPAGTALPLELTTAVSTETATVEMPVSARLRQDVEVGGVTALPAGAVLRGEVIDVARAGRVQGRSRLGLRFTSVTIDGAEEDLRTDPVMFEGEATKGEDAAKVGAGAGVGAVIGGLLGGGSGAAKGAAIGGAAGAGAVLATRGREVELASGSNIDARLASDVDVRVR